LTVSYEDVAHFAHVDKSHDATSAGGKDRKWREWFQEYWGPARLGVIRESRLLPSAITAILSGGCRTAPRSLGKAIRQS